MPPPVPAKPKRRWFWWTLLGVIAFLILIVTLTATLGSGKKPQASHTQAPVATSAPAAVPTTAAPVATQPAQPAFTIPQQQAVASALSYLSDGQGFSKAGLFKQLHSSFGEGFSVKLARFAVRQFDHPNVWRHQAVLSARGYMQSQPGWSYSGLVQQLDSPYGENFTVAQAEYAASRVGL